MPPPLTYTISVQRRESTITGRWREIASWTLTTTETDMAGPLNCGLRPNYRIIIEQTSRDPMIVSSAIPPMPSPVAPRLRPDQNEEPTK